MVVTDMLDGITMAIMAVTPAHELSIKIKTTTTAQMQGIYYSQWLLEGL
jgi:hypothetical protein